MRTEGVSEFCYLAVYTSDSLCISPGNERSKKVEGFKHLIRNDNVLNRKAPKVVLLLLLFFSQKIHFWFPKEAFSELFLKEPCFFVCVKNILII